ncbi:hypothetical protein BP6252_08215 [Coleophoma cylindrospora]|uniref:F-box domain-containing protein n=1 Tax=Coleophoma cylindrospora TaxID=1849047 RepID=A0A3D8R569_9HELO|nr:hypothetical protein BP6252_08215 [Coleophoma cylindrospora]
MSVSQEQQGSFAYMPTEIIIRIMSDACLQPSDWYCLSLVNKNLSHVAQKELYRQICLSVEQVKAWERLLRSFRGNAKLLSLVQHLRLKSASVHSWTPVQNINMAVTDILGLHLPALESLLLESVKINRCLFEIDPLLPVRYLRLHQTSLAHATALMLLPNIEKLHIGYIDDTVGPTNTVTAPSVSSALAERASRFSAVKDIRIDLRFNPYASLSQFVTWPRELRSFHGSIIALGSLSPALVDLYLEPVRETLVELSLEASTDDYTDVDGTFIYFERFKYVKELNTTASLLFGNNWNSHYAQRAGLYHRLPIALETLTIFFDAMTEAITTGREDEYLGKETPTDYLWIIELTNLPNFKYLRVEEDLSTFDNSPNYVSFQWQPHQIILQHFNSHSAQFEASLRSNKQHIEAMAARRTRMLARRAAHSLGRILQT